MLSKLLTIGIPTYNGAKYIERALDSFIIQITPEISGKIKILISDNASTDATQEIVFKYQKKYPELIIYFRNETNVGAGKNFDLVFQRADTEYVWIFGDDDYIFENTLLEIVKTVGSNKFDHILLNHYADAEGNILENQIGIKRDIICKSTNDFFDYTINACGFATANIIRRDLWLGVSYSSENWIHFEKIMNFPENTISLVVNKVVIKLSREEVRWNKNFEILFYFYELVEIIS